MRHWVFKSEPHEFSIDDLARVEREPWSGVRNYQARNFIRDEMQPGDQLLFYHSSCTPAGVVGVAEVAGRAYADPTQFDPRSDYYDAASDPASPRWLAVDVRFRRKLARMITLDELKAQAAALGDLALLRRGNRLSISPLSAAQFQTILDLE